MRQKIYAVPVLLAVLLLAGCVREQVGKSKLALGGREKKSYAKITNHQLTLELANPRLIYAGEGGEITFMLINHGSKQVNIEEWYTNEADNVVVSCQNFLPGMNGFRNDAWINLSFTPRQPPWRYPLILEPQNRVFITKKLPFVDKLRITPGSERRYFVKGKLNLTSLDVESSPAVIVVRNRADKRGKNVQSEKSPHFGR